ncbi:hypothetical protein [Aquibacillus salsiterrae]|uniref:Uncharacterized protein n=1 Tax=Aquibacillus salsiterrae TaxID=2950439 RepID=A0A9X3WFM1_9BACI|nr:hypothetical protein [Aquibacillus salsiterrae]MDC3416549.1 hypothetical protein [Aquibacillus salsiterrae]
MLLQMNFWLINTSQLVPLGITDELLQYFIGAAGVIGCYFILQPLIRLFVILEWTKLINYLLASFLFLIVFGFLYIVRGTIDANSVNQLANITFGISLFGVGLFLTYLVQSAISYFKQQRSKSI